MCTCFPFLLCSIDNREFFCSNINNSYLACAKPTTWKCIHNVRTIIVSTKRDVEFSIHHSDSFGCSEWIFYFAFSSGFCFQLGKMFVFWMSENEEKKHINTMMKMKQLSIESSVNGIHSENILSNKRAEETNIQMKFQNINNHQRRLL